MKKAFLLFITILTIQFTNAQELAINNAPISENTLLTTLQNFSPELKQNLIDIDAQVLWVSPLSQTIKIYVPVFPTPPIVIDGEEVSFENIIEVNNGLVKVPGGTGDDNFDFKLSLNLPDVGDVSEDIPLLEQYKLRMERNSVKVGIFDTGFNDNLANDMIPASSGGWDYINGGDNIIDDHFHGTHIVSTTHGLIKDDPNSIFVDYYNYKILDKNGEGLLSDIIIAAERAIVDHGVNILNFSLSGLNVSHLSVYLSNMLLAAENENVLFVISAGNLGIDIDKADFILPASLQGPNVITIASARANGKLSQFSNWGLKSVDILAPGENIDGLDNYGNPLILSGTSQATAIVTSVATMLGSYQDQFDGALIKCAIMSGASVSNGLINMVVSSGSLNSQSALEYLQSSEPCDPTVEFRQVKDISSSIFPNPAQESIFIELEEGEYTIQIADVMGRLIWNQNLSATGKSDIVDISNFNKGIYNMQIKNRTTEKVEMLKFVKQ